MKKFLTILVLFVLSLQLHAQATVEGYIHLPNGLPLPGVSVGPVETNEDGFYTFEVEVGTAITIVPFFDSFPMAAIDYEDLLAMQNLILGIGPVSPYKMIAADLNHSGSISSFDLIRFSKLVMGLDPLTSDEQIWVFVLADYVFPNPGNPWSENYPQIAQVNNPEEGMTYQFDFVAIKVGDVNCSFGLENTAEINGHFFYDTNEDCVQSGEDALEGFYLRLAAENYTVYTTTYENGYFSAFVAPGTYTPEVQLPNGYWTTCPDFGEIIIEQGDVFELDVPIQATVLCPNLEVDLATGVLRRCVSNDYHVAYRNTGTIDAEDAYVTVELDDFITLESSSIPWASVDGNTYTFPVGDVSRGESGNFSLQVLVSCEAELGQTHCTEAHIYPDSLCGPTNPVWDGSSLIVDGACDGDSVRFTITNIGEDMQSGVNYIVIEDDLIMYEGILNPLGTFESEDIPLEANGSTFRIEFHQTEGHPGLNRPGLSLEGCGTNGQGSFSTGFVVIYAENDADPFVSIDCRENVDSYDPNDKQGFPRGIGVQHEIEANQEIEYLIRFQNTGTAEAINIIIKDTLSALLNPGSIQLGASSHPYEFRLTDQGVLNFYFLDIMLPDSNTNEPASHGFIKFRIHQQPDLPIGSVIENSAAIYFDFNDPVITNTSFHTIGEDRLQLLTSVYTPEQKPLHWQVSPNPVRESLYFEIEDHNVSIGVLEFYAPQGQILQQQTFYSHKFTVDARELPSGICFYRLLIDGAVRGAGKVLVTD